MPIFFRAFSRSSIRPMVGNQQKIYLRWACPKIREDSPPKSPVPVGIYEGDPTLYKRPFCRRLLGGAEKLQIKTCLAESTAGIDCERPPTWANIQKHIGTLEKTYNRKMRENLGNLNKDILANISVFYDQITERKKRPRSRRVPARATLNIPQTRHHLSFLLTRLASRRRSRTHRRSPKDPPIIPAPPPTIRKFLTKRSRRKHPVRFSKTQGIEESFNDPPRKTEQPTRNPKNQVITDDSSLPEEEENFLPRQPMKKYRKKRIYQATRPPLRIPTTSSEDPRQVSRKAKRSARNKERELGSTDLGDGSEGVGSKTPTKLNKKQRYPVLLEENVDKEIEQPKKSSWLFDSDATISQNMDTTQSSVGIIRKKYTRRKGKSREWSSDAVHGQNLSRKAKPSSSQTEAKNQVLSSLTNLKRRKLIRKRSKADASVLWGPKRSTFKLGEGLKIKDYGLKRVKKATPPKEEEDAKNVDPRTTRRSFRTMDRASLTSARSGASDIFGRLSKSYDASIVSREDVEARRSWTSGEEATGDAVVPHTWDSPVDNDTFFEKIRRNLIMMTNPSKPSLREDVSFASKTSQDIPLNMYAYPTRIEVQDATEANPKKRLKKVQKRKKRRRVPLVDADTQTKCVCEICHYLRKFKPEKLPPIYAEVATRQKNLKNRQYYMDNLRNKNFTISDSDKPENPDDCRPIAAPIGNIKPDYHSKHTDPFGDDVKCNGKNIYMKRSLSASYWSLGNAYANKSRLLDDYKAPNVSKVFQRCYRTLFEADQQTTYQACQYQEKLCCT